MNLFKSSSVKQRKRGLFSNAYIYVSITFILAIFAFWPVYFSKLQEVRLSIHVHSILAMLWVLLLIVQSWLARKKRFKQHKAVGKLTYLLTPLLVLTTLMLFHSFLNTDSPFTDAFGLQIMFYDFVGLLYFMTAFILAVSYYRKQIEFHARLMISTIMMMLFPVIGRLFLFYADFGLGPGELLNLSIYLIDAIVLALVIFDFRKEKMNPVFPILLVVTIFQHIGFLFCKNWSLWQSFTEWYAAV